MFYIFGAGAMFAQTNNLSLIKGIINNKNLSNSIKIFRMDSVIYDHILFSEPDSALYFSELQYEFAKKHDFQKYMSYAISMQSVVYRVKGNYTKSVSLAFEVLKIRESLADSSLISRSYNSIGNIYFVQENLVKSLDYYNQALAFIKSRNDQVFKALILSNIGNVYLQQNDYKKASVYYYNYLKVSEENNDDLGISAALNNISTCYYLQKDYNRAIEYTVRSLKLYKKINNTEGVILTNNNLARIYLDLDDFETAIKYGKISFRLSKEINSANNYKESAYRLYLAYEGQKNSKDAFEMYKIYVSMKDSLGNLEIHKELVEKEIYSKYHKLAIADSLYFIEQKKINETEFRTEKKNYLFIIIIVLFMLIVVFRIKYHKKVKEKKLLLKQIELLKTKSIINKTIPSEMVGDRVLTIDRNKIEEKINGSLNETDWKILNKLYHNPTITNQMIAEKVYLSVDGVKYSLKKMYRIFDIGKLSENKRISLIVKVSEISF